MLLKKSSLVIPFFFLFFFIFTEKRGIASDRFPLYPCIASNVQFWDKVYSQYTTTQGILHDSNNLNIIYTAVDLVAWDSPGSSRINQKIIKITREHYSKILTNLGSGKPPATQEEIRVAALFPNKSRHAFNKARNNIRLQIGQKDRFIEGYIRSGALIESIKHIFRSYKLPTELAYLPHVESSYNNAAHSKASAVGIWQFTKGTGSQYLTINNELDERYDPLPATHAAAQFLQNNYAKLGSWPLALTAYNYGQAGMMRAIKQEKSYEGIFKNHKTRLFQFASRNFYSEFIAAMQVARRLESDVSIIPDHPEATTTVRMQNFVSAQSLVSYFKVSRQDFTRLNPSLRAPVLEGNKYIPKNYLLRLPATKLIKTLTQKIPSHLYHFSQIPDTLYKVRSGDTISAIAAKYKVTTKMIIQLNNLDSKATIRTGQQLKIPINTIKKKISVLNKTSKQK